MNINQRRSKSDGKKRTKKDDTSADDEDHIDPAPDHRVRRSASAGKAAAGGMSNGTDIDDE